VTDRQRDRDRERERETEKEREKQRARKQCAQIGNLGITKGRIGFKSHSTPTAMTINMEIASCG
jgi:hypothetical protein